MKPYDKIPIVNENFDDYILTNYKGKTYTISEKTLKNINPLLQNDFDGNNDCTLTSITTAVSYYRKNDTAIGYIYDNVKSIAKQYGYTDRIGTFSITVKSIYEKVLRYFRCPRKTKWRVLKPFANITTIIKSINGNQPVILNLLNDGRKYYHNHTVLVIGYKGIKVNNENELKYFLKIYDNWNKEVTYIDWQKLGYIFSINF